MKARLRTVDKAYNEIQAKDPETAISRYFIKQMKKQRMKNMASINMKRLSLKSTI